MNLAKKLTSIVSAVASLAAFAPTIVHATPMDRQPGVVASFEGRSIDLAAGWGEARACYSDGTSTRCYRTQLEMNAVEQADGTVHPLAVCASALTLYSSTGSGGTSLSLSARGTLIALSPYGFDNVTSSYQIGACTSRFYDTSSGGTLYPGSTTAGASASSMASGWNDRVSSVLIS